MRAWYSLLSGAPSAWQGAGWLLALAFPVLALVLDKAASTIFALFFLAGLCLLIRGRRERLTPELRAVLLAFAAYFLVGVLSFFLGEQTRLGEQLLGRDLRFLAAIPVGFALLGARLQQRLLLAALLLAAALSGLVAAAQVVVADSAAYRAGGETISIVFGHLAATLFAVSIVVCVNAQQRWRLAALGAASLALLAVVLSGTRAALAVAMVIGLGAFLAGGQGSFQRRLVAALALVAIGAGALLGGLAQPLEQRLIEGVKEIRHYRDLRAYLDNFPWPAAGTEACLDSTGLLERLVDAGLIRTGQGIRVRVVDGRVAEAETLRCEGAFLRLSNHGSRRARALMPSRHAGPGADGGALLVRGSGNIGQAGSGERLHAVPGGGWQVLRLGPSGEAASRHIVILAPGEQLDVVPLQTRADEYRFVDSDGSIAARAYMWRAAYEGALDSPWLGHGSGAFPALAAARAREGRSPWQITHFDHAHNEWLTVAVERGLLGVLALVAVYLAPLLLFWRRADLPGKVGLAFVLSVFLSGLSETVFNHSLGITYYCMLVLLLATVPRAPPLSAATSG